MEHEEESLRLDLKTRSGVVEKQATFAGIRPGMRVLDIGCGSGKTTSVLHDLVQPGGKATGIDISRERTDYALSHYQKDGLEFFHRDMRDPLDDLGMFDFIWMRFVLEYYRVDAWPVVKHVTESLRVGGTLCLIDLDHNCLCHYEMPERLEKTVHELMEAVEKQANFDPYVGRKLYSYFKKLGYKGIKINVGTQHLIYGELSEVDAYNWLKKIEVGIKRIHFDFHRYDSGYEEFVNEFMTFFKDPGRFTYTPLISVRGNKDRSDVV
jgi:SAM-dependent methyltransferase